MRGCFDPPMPEATCSAVLLDIDGTLVDTNYLHVDAWSRAVQDVGADAEDWRIHRAVGMDSGRLIATLLGDDAERLGDAVKERHREHYARNRPRMRLLAGARELLAELHGRGFRVVLATSATPDEFAMLTDVLQADEWVTTVTTSEDVSEAKPAPDVVGVALEKADVEAADAILVGDAVWDAESAERAGVRCVGVRTGGAGEQELLDAGALAVYEGAAHLLRELDASPLYER